MFTCYLQVDHRFNAVPSATHANEGHQNVSTFTSTVAVLRCQCSLVPSELIDDLIFLNYFCWGPGHSQKVFGDPTTGVREVCEGTLEVNTAFCLNKNQRTRMSRGLLWPVGHLSSNMDCHTCRTDPRSRLSTVNDWGLKNALLLLRWCTLPSVHSLRGKNQIKDWKSSSYFMCFALTN